MHKVWFVWRGVDKPLEERLLRDERKLVRFFSRKRDAKQAAGECDGRVVPTWKE